MVERTQNVANAAALEALTTRIRTCRDCKLRTLGKRRVPGDGSIHARIMFVGQAPGWQEDKRGIPFIGWAGEYLRATLDAVLEPFGYDWQDFYFTNIVKCFPGRQKGKGDREPPPYAVEACRHHLEEEIAVVQPELIVAVGDKAMRWFGIKGGINMNSGTTFDTEYGRVLALLHPAGMFRPSGRRNVPVFHTNINAIHTQLEGPLVPPPHTDDWTEYIF